MAISGRVAMAALCEPEATSNGTPGRARRRLRSVIDGVGALVVRRCAPTPPVATLNTLPGGDRSAARLDTLAGPLGVEPHRVPVRPGPVDKPAALAHYQALAEQVARERQLAELHQRRRALSQGPGVPRELWAAVAAPRRNGDPRHG